VTLSRSTRSCSGRIGRRVRVLGDAALARLRWARPILRVARGVIPCDFGMPLGDEILGGALGPGRWKRYEKGDGTTCGIVVGYMLEQAEAGPIRG
jgi:hypothetical protein